MVADWNIGGGGGAGDLSRQGGRATCKRRAREEHQEREAIGH